MSHSSHNIHILTFLYGAEYINNSLQLQITSRIFRSFLEFESVLILLSHRNTSSSQDKPFIMAPAHHKPSNETLRHLRPDYDYTIDPLRPTRPFQRSDPRWKQARARYTTAVWQSFSNRPVPARLYRQACGLTQRAQLPVREKPCEVLLENSQEVLQDKRLGVSQKKSNEPVTRQDIVETPPQAPE